MMTMTSTISNTAMSASDIVPTSDVNRIVADSTNQASSVTKAYAPSKYRHIKAFHSQPKASCLSHDAEIAPSFLGFRNLMVIVLSTPSFALMINLWEIRYDTNTRTSCNEFTISCREFYESMSHRWRIIPGSECPRF